MDTPNYHVLVVDDLRRFDAIVTAPVTYARTSADAIAIMERNIGRSWDQVWLDHDLGEDDDIRPVVRWIEEHQPKIKAIYVQSQNPVGASWVVKSLERLYPTQRVNHPLLKVPTCP